MDLPIIVYIVLVVVLILIFIIFTKYNKLIRLQSRVKKAKANIEACLNKRFDLIPNLVECVKGYSKHEGSTLENIVSLRNQFKEQKKTNINEAGELNKELNNLLVVVEDYPELKANTQYLDLQKELSSVENDLERERKIYNDIVTEYNIAVEVVPDNIIASIFAFKKAELFQIEDDKKENINIDIDNK